MGTNTTQSCPRHGLSAHWLFSSSQSGRRRNRSRKLCHLAKVSRVKPDLCSESLTLEFLTIQLSCLVMHCVGGGGRNRLHFFICLASKLMPLPMRPRFLPIMKKWSDLGQNSNKRKLNSSSQPTLPYP